MTTVSEKPQADATATAIPTDTLTITDNRTGKAVRGPDRGRNDPSHRAAQHQDRR